MRERVQGFLVSGSSTPQCLLASYSRSLLDFFSEEGGAGCATWGCTILPSTSFLVGLGLDSGDTVM